MVVRTIASNKIAKSNMKRRKRENSWILFNFEQIFFVLLMKKNNRHKISDFSFTQTIVNIHYQVLQPKKFPNPTWKRRKREKS